ncbi:MAG: hypothetical protein V7641_4797 [Blastocatellia bacterium]
MRGLAILRSRRTWLLYQIIGHTIGDGRKKKGILMEP